MRMRPEIDEIEIAQRDAVDDQDFAADAPLLLQERASVCAMSPSRMT